MERSQLALAGLVASAIAGAIGLWFWQTESNYAANHPNTELAGVLQWVGIALAALGLAGILFALALMRGPRR